MILVTGATGMTGHFVVQELQKRNYPVRVLVREASVEKAPPGADIAIGDLGEPGAGCGWRHRHCPYSLHLYRQHGRYCRYASAA